MTDEAMNPLRRRMIDEISRSAITPSSQMMFSKVVLALLQSKLDAEAASAMCASATYNMQAAKTATNQLIDRIPKPFFRSSNNERRRRLRDPLMDEIMFAPISCSCKTCSPAFGHLRASPSFELTVRDGAKKWFHAAVFRDLVWSPRPARIPSTEISSSRDSQ